MASKFSQPRLVQKTPPVCKKAPPRDNRKVLTPVPYIDVRLRWFNQDPPGPLGLHRRSFRMGKIPGENIWLGGGGNPGQLRMTGRVEAFTGTPGGLYLFNFHFDVLVNGNLRGTGDAQENSPLELVDNEFEIGITSWPPEDWMLGFVTLRR